MKKVKMFVMATCPYCKAARGWMDELYAQYPAYNNIEVEIIDENLHSDIADQHDYYYVPTYYVDDVKVHEGAASYEIVKGVFDAALAQ
ncbi:MAG: thioredoxin family protein [Oscillospiraceae bacterium]|nr:thioredoxin family protein [Oscillospiraceae bacterium]